MKRIIIDNGDGTVGILIPAKNTKLSLEEIALKDVPEGLSYEIVDVSAVPSDRTFRDAWGKKKGGVKVDMVKARNIHMGRIREARDKKLVDLDLAYMKADEAGNGAQKADIAAQKNKLRDIPNTFDLTVAKTPEQLKKLWPEELK